MGMAYLSVYALGLHAADGELHVQVSPCMHPPPVGVAPHQITWQHLQGQPSLAACSHLSRRSCLQGQRGMSWEGDGEGRWGGGEGGRGLMSLSAGSRLLGSERQV